MLIFIRFTRIFEFVIEIEKLRFFIKAISVIRNSFFSIIFTLYSVFHLYTMLGVYYFGGLIN